MEALVLSDHGSIDGYPVERALKAGRTIVYTLPEGHTLSAGQAVYVTIDWPRRYRLMRLHFAAELVLERRAASARRPCTRRDLDSFGRPERGRDADDGEPVARVEGRLRQAPGFGKAAPPPCVTDLDVAA